MHDRSIRRVLVAAVLTVLPAWLVMAAPLSLDTTAGFNNLVKLGRFNPVTVRVHNNGSRFSGELTVEVTRGASNRTPDVESFTKHMDLAAGTTKQYTFSIPLLSSTAPITVRVMSGDSEVLSQEVSLIGRTVQSSLVLGLSRDTSLDFLMSASGPGTTGYRDPAEPAADSGQGPDFVVTYPLVEMLPDRWDGYDSVDYIVVHDTELEAMNAAQATAIATWVDAGGVLLVTGGTHLHAANTPLASLLPVRVAGLARLDRVDSLEALTGRQIGRVAPFPVTAARLLSGSVLARQDGLPLFVEKREGRGAEYFLELDIGSYPVADWPGRYALWERVAAAAPTRLSVGTPEGTFSSPLLSDLIDLSRSPSEARVTGFVVLAAYLLIVYAALRTYKSQVHQSGAGRRRKRRAPAGWIAAAMYALLFSTLSYVLFSRLMLRSALHFIDVTSVETTPGRRYAEVSKDLVLVSLSDTRYRLSIDAMAGMIRSRNEGSLSVLEGERSTIEAIRVPTWSQASFNVRGVYELPVTGSLQRRGDTATVRVDNESTEPLTDAVIIYRGQARYLGVIGGGESVEQDYEYVDSPPDERELAAAPFGKEEDPVKLLVYEHAIDDQARHAALASRSAVLVAFLGREPLVASTDRDFLVDTRVSYLVMTMQMEGGSYAHS